MPAITRSMSIPLRTVDGVKNLMLNCVNDDDWNNNCLLVKEANNGTYPSFWFKEIIMERLIEFKNAGLIQNLEPGSRVFSKNY